MTNIEPSDAGEQAGPTRFGGFIAPDHPLHGNPTLQLRRDIELAQLLDELGFDEVWFGEHHSTGLETIGSPELMIAAAGERTKRIRLGTGVNSVSYHDPFILADRIVQLDHLTQGRVIMGIGPGQLPSDAFMMGIDPLHQRRMMGEALEAIVPLIRGESVTMKTDWFDLRRAQLQLLPHSPDGIEIAVASVFSPTGVTLAGRHGLNVLSFAAGVSAAARTLSDNWQIHEKVAAEHGNPARRDRWRLVNQMHLSTTVEQAHRDLEYSVIDATHYLESAAGNSSLAWRASAQAAVKEWSTAGLPGWGTVVAGTPDMAIERIDALTKTSGGFGTLLLRITDTAPFDATCRSLELFAEHVIPHFRGSNRNRERSMQWAHENRDEQLGSAARAIEEATGQN